jgi:hypothetical protein
MQLYGWDAGSATWHGPNELNGHTAPDAGLLSKLRAVSGKSWYGPVNCCTEAGRPPTRFFALVHDLSDSAVASLYCNESKAGPAEILAVLPAARRAHLREEFAFEFLSYARFLGSLGADAELRVHEAMVAALAEPRADLVFSLSTGMWPGDLDHVLSRCVETVAVTVCRWLNDSA